MESQLIVKAMELTGINVIDKVLHSATPIDLATRFSSCFHNGSMGRTEYEVWVFAHTSDGLFPLPCVGERRSSNYAYSQRSETEAGTLAESLAVIAEPPKGIIVVESDYDSWEGQEESTDEKRVTYYPWVAPDTKKIRRRVEDRLRKIDDPQLIIDLAVKLGVSIA